MFLYFRPLAVSRQAVLVFSASFWLSKKVRL